jgi:hypothetical protein
VLRKERLESRLCVGNFGGGAVHHGVNASHESFTHQSCVLVIENPLAVPFVHLWLHAINANQFVTSD